MAGSYLAIARRAAPTDPPVRNFTASKIPKGTEVNVWYGGVSCRAWVSTGANKSGALEVKFFTTKGFLQKKTHKVNISAIDTINPEWNVNEDFSVTRVLDVLRKEKDSSLQFSVEWSNGQITREVESDGYYDQVAASGAADTFLMEAFAPGVEGDCVKFAASGSGGDREVNVLASAIEFSNLEGNQCNDPSLLQPGAKILVLFELLGAPVECSVIDGRVGRAGEAKQGSTGKRKVKFISEDAIPEEPRGRTAGGAKAGGLQDTTKRQHHDAEEEDAEGPSSNVGKEKASPETSHSNSKREDEDDGMARRLRKLRAEVDQKPWMRQFYFGVPDKDIDALVTSGMAPERPFYDATTLRLQTYCDLVDTSRRHNNMEWLHQMNDEMMDDFVDVADDEKKFMKTWNAFIRRSHIIADREVPAKCTDFVATHLQFLRDEGLRLQLLLHLFNLWDSGVISSERISACMRMYDQGVGTNGTHDSETQGDGGVSQLTEATGLMDSQNVQHDSQLSAQPAETQEGGVSQLTEATGLMDSQNVQHDSQLSAQPAETQEGGVSQLTEATGLMDSQNVQHDSQLSAQPAETQGVGGVSQLTEATGLMDSQNVQHDSQLSAQPAESVSEQRIRRK